MPQRLDYELNKIGVNLNQVAKRLKPTRFTSFPMLTGKFSGRYKPNYKNAFPSFSNTWIKLNPGEMVIKIHQVASTENALMHNEKKVQQGIAVFFDSRNTISFNPFMYNEKHRLKILADIEKLNPREKNRCLHISFNPSKD